MILQKGDKNTDVLAWQQFLNTQGYQLTADKDFGEKTANATRFFQAKHGLRGDGIVGENTLKIARELGFETKLIEKIVVTPTPAETAFFATSENFEIDRKNEAHLAKVAPTLQRRGRGFIAAAKAAGVTVQIVQSLRTFAEQDGLYAKGRTKPGNRVTNARGGQSLHNYGLALDFAPVVGGVISWDEKQYRKFGEFADAAGLEWGGRWKFLDLPHVQDDEGLTLAEIQQIYKQGGLPKLWAKIL